MCDSGILGLKFKKILSNIKSVPPNLPNCNIFCRDENA